MTDPADATLAASICHVASRDNWLYVLARTSTAGPPETSTPDKCP